MKQSETRKMFLLCSSYQTGHTTLGCMATNFRCVSFFGGGFTQAARVKPCPSESIRDTGRAMISFVSQEKAGSVGSGVWRIATPSLPFCARAWA